MQTKSHHDRPVFPDDRPLFFVSLTEQIFLTSKRLILALLPARLCVPRMLNLSKSWRERRLARMIFLSQ